MFGRVHGVFATRFLAFAMVWPTWSTKTRSALSAALTTILAVRHEDGGHGFGYRLANGKINDAWAFALAAASMVPSAARRDARWIMARDSSKVCDKNLKETFNVCDAEIDATIDNGA